MEVSNTFCSLNPPLSTNEKAATSIIVFIALAAMACFAISHIFTNQPSPFTPRLSWIYLSVGVSLGVGIIVYLASREPPPRIEKPKLSHNPPPAAPPIKAKPLPREKRPKIQVKALLPQNKVKNLEDVPDALILHTFTFLTFHDINDLCTTTVKFYNLFQNKSFTEKVILLPRRAGAMAIYANVAKKLRNLMGDLVLQRPNIGLLLPNQNQIEQRDFDSSQFLRTYADVHDIAAVAQNGLNLTWCAEVGFIEGVNSLIDNNNNLQIYEALKAALKGQHWIIIAKLWSKPLTPQQRLQIFNDAITLSHKSIFKKLFESVEQGELPIPFDQWIRLFTHAVEHGRKDLLVYLIPKFQELNRRVEYLNQQLPPHQRSQIPSNVDVLSEPLKMAISKDYSIIVKYLLGLIEKERRKGVVLSALHLIPRAETQKQKDTIIALLSYIEEQNPQTIIETLAKKGHGDALGVLLEQINLSFLNHEAMLNLFRNASSFVVIRGLKKFFDYIPIEEFLKKISSISPDQNAWQDREMISGFDNWLCRLEAIPGLLVNDNKPSLLLLNKYLELYPSYYQELLRRTLKRR